MVVTYVKLKEFLIIFKQQQYSIKKLEIKDKLKKNVLNSVRKGIKCTMF